MTKEPKVTEVSKLESRHLRNLPWFTSRGLRGDYLTLNIGTLEAGKWGGWHQHVRSEEIYYVLKGSGKFIWEEGGKIIEQDIKEGDLVWQSEGLWNQTVAGNESLVLVYAVAPISNLPTSEPVKSPKP
jgi:mannose-6-phosphate isomerase-like protein (cupin superfamily)